MPLHRLPQLAGSALGGVWMVKAWETMQAAIRMELAEPFGLFRRCTRELGEATVPGYR